jgi:glutaredoxin
MRASTKLAVALALLALAALADAQTSVYRWVDKNGKVQYSDQPPPEEVKSLTQKRMGGPTVDVSQLPYATQIAMQKFPVSMFGAPDCGDLCVRGRDLLSKRGIPYGERNVQNNPADAEAVKKLIGTIEVPVLLVGDMKVKGFDEGSWHSALDTAGYPRTALPGQIPPKPPAANAPK